MSSVLSTQDKIKLFPFWLCTLLPLEILYLVSDFLFLIAFYLVRYRRKVVAANLKNAFPEKSRKELYGIERRFYRYLADYFIESIYTINMSPAESKRRFIITNPEALIQQYEKGRNVIVGLAHYGNWEWANRIPEIIPSKFIAVYRPLSNKLFDRLYIYIRTKFGGNVVKVKSTLRALAEAKKNNEYFSLYLLGDQRPIREDLDYWTMFLNQDTPVITGIERLPRKFNAVVYYMRVRRIRRGYYSATFELITDKPEKEKENAIVEKFIRTVEGAVIAEPEYWFWSHKRWRYSPQEFKPGYSN